MTETGIHNSDEIDALRYPGDSGSHPGQDLCAAVTVTMDELLQMPEHTQFGLANTTKQQFDFYATYTGVKITDILEAVGVELSGATSVDVMAPDGYARSFTIEQITQQYPDHRFWTGFDVDALGADCAFVEYPARDIRPRERRLDRSGDRSRAVAHPRLGARRARRWRVHTSTP